MILYHVVAYKEPSPVDWLSVWLDNAVSLTGVDAWPQSHRTLKSVMWVNFVHDGPGEKVFEAAIQRLERLKEFDNECVSL
jgi:hypothetical protein